MTDGMLEQVVRVLLVSTNVLLLLLTSSNLAVMLRLERRMSCPVLLVDTV